MTTGIEWTDETWNPVTGCSKVSQGCKHCYALREWPRLAANPKLPAYHGRKFTDVRCHPERLDQPLRWRRPRRIFVNSMSDLFHEDVPFEFIDQVFAVMALAPWHTYQLLTKRPERMRRYITEEGLYGRILSAASVFREKRPDLNRSPISDPAKHPHPNIWFGVSVEDQATADERIPVLLDTPAAVRWISAEPLLGSIDLGPFQPFCQRPIPAEVTQEMRSLFPAGLPNTYANAQLARHGLDWIVAGGESGPKARPSHPDWFRMLRDQCEEAGVPFVFKQWGEWLPADQDECPMGPAHEWRNLAGESPRRFQPDEMPFMRLGKRRAGRTLDGIIHDEYPSYGVHRP